MNKKDLIVISVLVNAGLLVILLISALTSKESYLVASSAEVASDILRKDEKGMIATAEEFPSLPGMEEENKDAALHQLPEMAIAPKEESEEGEVDLIAAKEVQEISVPAIAPVLTPAVAVLEENKESLKTIDIKVKSGDSLEKLARRYHVTIKEIQSANNLTGSFLKKGQDLKIPVKTGAKKIDLIEGSQYYTVKAGDNPWTIAMKHHLNLEDLLKMNNLDKKKAKKLRAGDKLRVK